MGREKVLKKKETLSTEHIGGSAYDTSTHSSSSDDRLNTLHMRSDTTMRNSKQERPSQPIHIEVNGESRNSSDLDMNEQHYRYNSKTWAMYSRIQRHRQMKRQHLQSAGDEVYRQDRARSCSQVAIEPESLNSKDGIFHMEL